MEKEEKRRSNECELQAGRDPVQRVLRFTNRHLYGDTSALRLTSRDVRRRKSNLRYRKVNESARFRIASFCRFKSPLFEYIQTDESTFAD